MKILLSENIYKLITENSKLDRVQYPYDNQEWWYPTPLVGIATTPPRISREYKSGIGYCYIVEITRIAFVPKKSGNDYIRLLDFGEDATSPEESRFRQENSIQSREEMEYESVNNFFGIGFTEKQAWFYFWNSWKKVFPTTKLIIEHQNTNHF